MISNCGHDENGKLASGQAGDQTGGEYAVRTWYNRPWARVLRHPNADVGNLLADIARAAANNSKIGYDQNQRLTYYDQLKAASWHPEKITVACESDCSASTAANIIAVGHRLGLDKLKGLSPSMVTSNERKALEAIGFVNLTDSKYLTSDAYLLPGDILLYDGHHTAVNLDTGAKVAKAPATASQSTSAAPRPTATQATGGTYTFQDFVREIQDSIGAKVDGVAGPETLGKTPTVSMAKNNRHTAIKALQKRLNVLGFDCGVVDGIAGQKFDIATRQFQGSFGGVKDGEFTSGKASWKKILGLS